MNTKELEIAMRAVKKNLDSKPCGNFLGSVWPTSDSLLESPVSDETSKGRKSLRVLGKREATKSQTEPESKKKSDSRSEPVLKIGGDLDFSDDED
jgi:hypothetical protein